MRTPAAAPSISVATVEPLLGRIAWAAIRVATSLAALNVLLECMFCGIVLFVHAHLGRARGPLGSWEYESVVGGTLFLIGASLAAVTLLAVNVRKSGDRLVLFGGLATLVPLIAAALDVQQVAERNWALQIPVTRFDLVFMRAPEIVPAIILGVLVLLYSLRPTSR